MNTRRRLRSWAAYLAVSATAIALLVGLPATVAPTETAEAAVGSDFNAGNIISDAVFYDSAAMTAGEVQDFLNRQVSRCSSGYTCLKDYRQNTDNRPSDRYCSGYTGRANESSAQIIDNVARSCGISQKVLLVLLQKEQSLVTSTAPSARAYSAATGQGCPDTAPCDAATSGFFYQVYYAARQYEIYRLTASSWGYQAGRWNNILYHPEANRGCGSARVYIENQATAGLYIYTPYTPNAAALNNLYGTGDNCSSYGNRNFWRLFTDWFGSTRVVSGQTAIPALHAQLGGAGGVLGAAVEGVKCGIVDNGCYQLFQKGQIHWSAATGAHATRDRMLAKWGSLGFEGGNLGYPTGEQDCSLPNEGCYQNFQNGKIYYSATTDVHAVWFGTLVTWAALGYERGTLGYPVTDETCGLIGAGCYQRFQGGQVHSSPASGTHATRGEILAKWASMGYEKGTLGYPTSEEECGLPNGGCYQNFQNGKLYWSPSTGAHPVWFGALVTWAGLGYERGALGYPITDETCGLAGAGCFQDFERGRIHSSPASGTHATQGAISTRWTALGSEKGTLGYPTSEQNCGLPNNGCYQDFQNGKMYSSPSSGVYPVWFGSLVTWAGLGYERGVLGYPITDETCGLIGAGCYQRFQGGQIHSSPASGTYATRGEILAKWASLGYEKGALGYPISAEECGLPNGGCYQNFQNGKVYWSPSTGAHPVAYGMLIAWAQQGYERGALGYPTSDEQCSTNPTACQQKFQGGTIDWTPQGGALITRQ